MAAKGAAKARRTVSLSIRPTPARAADQMNAVCAICAPWQSAVYWRGVIHLCARRDTVGAVGRCNRPQEPRRQTAFGVSDRRGLGTAEVALRHVEKALNAPAAPCPNPSEIHPPSNILDLRVPTLTKRVCPRSEDIAGEYSTANSDQPFTAPAIVPNLMSTFIPNRLDCITYTA